MFKCWKSELFDKGILGAPDVRFVSSWINRLWSRYKAGFPFDFQVNHQKLRFLYFEKLSLNVEKVNFLTRGTLAPLTSDLDPVGSIDSGVGIKQDILSIFRLPVKNWGFYQVSIIFEDIEYIYKTDLAFWFCSMSLVWFVLRFNWFGLISLVWLGLMFDWYSLAWIEVWFVWFGMFWGSLGLVWFGLRFDWFDLVRIKVRWVWFGLWFDWFGLRFDWFGLVWGLIGLVWFKV